MYRGKAVTPDYRRWGGYYWFQNTREPYWAMLYSGDLDHMEPLWKMYRDAVPLLKARTLKYFNHEGIFYSETMYPWGLNRQIDFGIGNEDVIPESPFIRYYWDSGIELSMMLLDTYAQTQDTSFVEATLIPIADEVVKFYDHYYERNAEGRVHFSPSMSLETWHTAEDPLPVIVGLHTVLSGLLALPESSISEEQQQRWKRFRSELPETPLGEADGRRWIEPARTYTDRKNSENPELYAVFPYRAYGLGKPDLAQSSDPILSEAAKRTASALEGDYGMLAADAPDYSNALGRLIAFDGLLQDKPARALEVAQQTLADTEAVGRMRILTAAAHTQDSKVRNAVLAELLKGSEAEQLIAVVAIHQGGLTEYESAVLALLPSVNGQLRNEVVACLGVIGADDSFNALYALYEANPKDKSVQEAVAAVKAASADAQALSDAVNGSSLESRVAAIKLLGLRNPEGGTALLNGLLHDAASMDADVRKATYQTLETIGNIETVNLMLDPNLLLSDFKRDTQLSLKRLALSLGIPAALWKDSFEPALVANDTDAYRAAILEIFDAVACAESVEYLKAILKDPASSDYSSAYRVLQRWPQEKNLYAADMWLLIYAAETASEAEQAKAQAAITKLLQNRHPDFYPAQINLLLEVGKSDLPVEFKQSLFSVYAAPGDHFYAWYFPQAKHRLQPALQIPDVAEIAQQIINQLE
jgi:hypothetical protein